MRNDRMGMHWPHARNMYEFGTPSQHVTTCLNDPSQISQVTSINLFVLRHLPEVSALLTGAGRS